MTLSASEMAAVISAVIESSKGNAAWAPVVASAVTSVISVVVTIVTLIANHNLTRYRDQENLQSRILQEEKAAREKLQTELQFISAGLIFLLEGFAQQCADVAADHGKWRDEPGKQAERRPVTGLPSLSLDGISGNWQVIPPWLLYQLHALPVRTQEAHTDFFAQTDHMGAYDDVEFFSLRQESFALPGLHAIRLARCLRRLSGYPDTRLADSSWSPLQVMWRVHRRGVGRRTVRRAMEAETDAGL